MGGKLLFCTESNFIRIFKVRCGHRTLRFAMTMTLSVGVDAHIDPRIFAKALSY